MKLKSALLALAAALLVLGRAPADAPSSTAVAAVTANYKIACAAVMNPTDANEQAWFALIAPDYKYKDLKGKTQLRDETVASEQQQLKTFHGTACDATVEMPTSSDAGTVVVVQTQKVEGDFQAPDGKHNLDLLNKSKDTWKLVNGAWLLCESEDLRTVLKIDGAVQDDEGQ
jgi:hypothetical protein